MASLGFIQSAADPNHYLLEKGEELVHVLAYLGDILIFSNAQLAFDGVVYRLQASHEIRFMYRIERLLGISVIDGDEKILMQSETMIEKF